MQRILVTGGAGFIGSSFVRAVLHVPEKIRVINLDRLTYAGNLASLADVERHPSYRFVQGDVCDRELLDRIFREEAVDTVVHLAAESHVDRSILGPDEFVRTNITGTYTLLEATRSAWKEQGGTTRRFLHVSTDEVYGSLGETGKFSETTPYDPRSPYSASKAASDHLVSSYFHTYGLPTLKTNCSNNYGPYQFPEKLIPLMVLNALAGEPLPVYGDGENVRDWIHVDDHCAALLAVLRSGQPGGAYNVGGDSERANIDLVQTICDLVDLKAAPLPGGEPRRSLIRFVTDRPGHDRRYAVDAGKIRKELGWEPAVSLESGLERTVCWYLQNTAWVDAVRDGSYREYYDRQYSGR